MWIPFLSSKNTSEGKLTGIIIGNCDTYWSFADYCAIFLQINVGIHGIEFA